jgi:uncharacterized protein (TIGR00251 family)
LRLAFIPKLPCFQTRTDEPRVSTTGIEEPDRSRSGDPAMSNWCRKTGEDTWVLSIHAQPGAKRTEVAGLHGEALKIRVKAPALEDRANEALAEFIAEALGVARRDVTLVSGSRSREKRFEVRGAGVDPARLLSP